MGHLGVKLALAMGAEVTVISTSESKRNEAVNEFGAHHFVSSKDPEQMSQTKRTLDFILDTVSGPRNIDEYLNLLKPGGIIVPLAVPKDYNFEFIPKSLISVSRGIVGSVAGGLKQTEEMLDFCASHQIMAKIELIKMDEINSAFDRMVNGQVRYRFVIDVENSEF